MWCKKKCLHNTDQKKSFLETKKFNNLKKVKKICGEKDDVFSVPPHACPSLVIKNALRSRPSVSNVLSVCAS